MTLRTRIGEFDLRAEHTRLEDFTSEELVGFEELEHRTELRLNGRLPLGKKSLPFTLTASSEQSGDLRRDNVDLRLFAFLKNLNISTNLNIGQAGDLELTRGSLLLSGTWKGLSLFGDASYDLAPEANLRNISLTAEKPLRPNLILACA